jgi:hypothetical protein
MSVVVTVFFKALCTRLNIQNANVYVTHVENQPVRERGTLCVPEHNNMTERGILCVPEHNSMTERGTLCA